jgi:hypothetical protein
MKERDDTVSGCREREVHMLPPGQLLLSYFLLLEVWLN